MPISSHEHRKLTAFQSVHDQSVYVSMCPWQPPVVSVHNQTPEYLKRLFKPFTTDYGLRDNENKFGLREPCIDFLKLGSTTVGRISGIFFLPMSDSTPLDPMLT